MTPRKMWLTERQLAVLTLIGRGLCVKRIASELGIAEATVHEHTARIYRFLGIASRTEAAVRACHLGLLGPTPREECLSAENARFRAALSAIAQEVTPLPRVEMARAALAAEKDPAV